MPTEFIRVEDYLAENDVRQSLRNSASGSEIIIDINADRAFTFYPIYGYREKHFQVWEYTPGNARLLFTLTQDQLRDLAERLDR